MSEEVFSSMFTPDELVLWGVAGSQMYNLATPSSDVDLIAVVDSPRFRKNTFIPSEERDMTILPVEGYDLLFLDKGSYNLVDFQAAPSTRWNLESKWYHYLRSMRPDGYKYLESIRKHLKKAAPRIKPKQVVKLEMLYDRAVSERRIRPVFTEAEREEFFDRLGRVS